MASLSRITAVIALLLLGGNVVLSAPHSSGISASEICGSGIQSGKSVLASAKAQALLSHKEAAGFAPSSAVLLQLKAENAIVPAANLAARTLLITSTAIRGPPAS